MDNARVLRRGGGRQEEAAWVFCLLLIGSREGKGGGEGLSLVVTCSGYFESNKSTLSVLLLLYSAGVCSCAYTPYSSCLRLAVCSWGPGGFWVASGSGAVRILKGLRGARPSVARTVSTLVRWSCICAYVRTERNVPLFSMSLGCTCLRFALPGFALSPSSPGIA